MKKWMKTKHFRILFCCVFFGLLFVGMIFLNRFWSKVEVDCGFSTTCYDSMLEKCTLAKVLISYEDFGISYTFVNEIKGYTEGRCEVNTIIYKVDSLDFAEHIDSAKKLNQFEEKYTNNYIKAAYATKDVLEKAVGINWTCIYPLDARGHVNIENKDEERYCTKTLRMFHSEVDQAISYIVS